MIIVPISEIANIFLISFKLQDFLEAEYLGEQVDGIKEIADLLTKLERTTAGSQNCDGLGLHMIDEELKSKYSK